ncbi:MAG TPA: FtsX-like permease family protein [Thermoanaerobaculia bacterium]
MSPLDRKLLRDLAHLWGQMTAVALVVTCGVGMFVTLRSMHRYLQKTQAGYYEQYRFAEVFAQLKRAPLPVASRIAALPEVAAAEPRIVMDVLLDVPGLPEPATGRLVSIPRDRRPALNDLHLRRGRWIAGRDEALVSEAFARANRLEIGDTVGAVIHGRWQRLRIVGLALSPEYIYEIRGAGDVFPDNHRFGVIWMAYGDLAAAFDLEGAFNDLVLTLAPGASESAVLGRLDRELARYGGVGAYGREDHVSHRFVSDEIAETRVTSVVIPAIFLGVTAFLLHIVMSRLVATQRDQIAVLKAFGYSDSAVGGHFLKLALAPALAGAAAGSAVGLWFAVGLARVYARFYQFPVLRYEPEPGIVGLAVLIGGGAALFGAWDAARRAMALPPAEAMRPEAPARFHKGWLERLAGPGLASPETRILLRNLERRPWKSLLSVLGVALAGAIVVLGWYAFDAIQYMKNVQFRAVQREDVTVVLREPSSSAVRHALAGLPGVLRVEPFRMVAARLRNGHRSYRTTLQGIDPRGELRRVVDRGFRRHDLPPDGVLLTARLAERLDVRPGDRLTVEVLEGARPVREVMVAGVADEMIGMSAYLELGDLNRLMREGGTVSGAWLAVDPPARDDLYARLKRLPAVAGVGVREAALRGFESTIAESFRLSISTLIGFACVISFGVIYNGARIALSERGRELASLRILGFSRAEVASMLLGEQALLTLAALPLGASLGFAVCALLAFRFESDLFRLPLAVSAQTYLYAFLTVAASALASGLAVRRRLDRLDLVEVLKTRE